MGVGHHLRRKGCREPQPRRRANGKREWGFFLVQKGGSVIKLEYTNKDEGDAARIILSKGEHVHKVTSEKPLFAISDALTQAFVTGLETPPKVETAE